MSSNHRFPDSPVFYRNLQRTFPLIVRGEGIYLFDEQGKRYLDGSSGAMVVNVGHGVPEIADAVAAQLRQVAYVNGTQFTNAPVEALARELLEVLPPPLRYSYFLSSGSEAIEAAVKLARQVCLERGRPGKWKVITRTPAYHGNTMLALSLSAREHYRKSYQPYLGTFPRIACPDDYRHPGCPACTGDALEAAILTEGPESVAAFLAEPIVGSSGGALVPGEGYYRRIREICDRYDVLFIADEILAGMGRTGRWLSLEHWEVAADIVTLGKGLTGGTAPLSAVVARPELVELLAANQGYFNHAQTFSHAPAACAAGLATLRYLKQHRLVERAATLEAPFFDALRRLDRHAIVGSIRGKGLLAGIELVADRTTKEPFARSERVAERLTARALERGLIVWPNVGNVDGQRGDLLLVAPPLVISKAQLDELVGLLDEALTEL
ncbi:MAG: aminotransferase class III-fold pyridoxal phosphate-dependent enzyme [Deltaproteobacteria bacterium]|nr:aminotransferase class III-fold pyridoxal phosphate-dependent enzyme [Deltaproteobacteria bacterium]